MDSSGERETKGKIYFFFLRLSETIALKQPIKSTEIRSKKSRFTWHLVQYVLHLSWHSRLLLESSVKPWDLRNPVLFDLENPIEVE